MRNKLYILTLFALILCGCQDFDTPVPSMNESGLMVSLDIPEPVVAKTRAGLKDDLSSLYVLVFDKNGLYLSKHEGVFTSGTTTTANYRFGSIPTTREGELLILHFVANYDWTKFSDANNVGKSEAEVMNNLTVTNNVVTYWQRIELPDGLVGVKGTIINLKEDVSLFRNRAKITVANLTIGAEVNKHLTNVTYAIGNYADRGTVAPYSSTSHKFVKGAVTEVMDANIIPITNENVFVSAQNGSSGAASEATYVYERKNSTARNQMYIILKAYFQTSTSGTNTTVPSYYKIDIADKKSTVLLDIERNYHYIIQINDVAMAGYPTLKEAVDNPASNNINAAVQVAEYTSVSDGTNILQIEKAVFTFVTSGQDFQIKCSYFNGTTGQIDNAKLTVSLEQDPSMEVIKNGSLSYSDGIISATTADIPLNNDIYQATLTVTDGNFLSRKITIRLRKPMNLLNVSVTPNNGTDPTYCKVANEIGQPVTITFSFPPDISPHLFPLPVYIYSRKLSPDPTKEGIQPLSVDPTPNNTFRYVYMAPYLDNDAYDVPVPHKLYLVTSTPSANEDVILASNYFNDVKIQLRSTIMPALENVLFDPNPVIKIGGTPVTLSFDIPDVPDKSLPYKIRIHSDYLTSIDSNCIWDEVMGVFYYTTRTAGNQQVAFKTKQAESAEYVRIDGDRFASITVKRSMRLGEFKNVSADVSAGAVGTPVNVQFSLDEAGAIYANNGIYVYFTTQYLEPAPNSGIEVLSNENEYRMWVSSTGIQTARFSVRKMINIWEGETITMSSPSLFKPYLLSYVVPGKYTFGSKIPAYTSRPVFTQSDTETPLSLASLTGADKFDLHFTIPTETKVNRSPISSSNPLWIYLTLENSYFSPRSYQVSHIGIEDVFTDNRNNCWLKITEGGDKVLKLGNLLYLTSRVATMMSVSDNGVKVSNGLFETATGFENK